MINDKCFLIGLGPNETPELDSDELINVQEIECPLEYQQELSRMITCQVVLEPKLETNIGNIVLRCSMCRENFSRFEKLVEHKKIFKICDNNLEFSRAAKRRKVGNKKIIRKKFSDYDSVKRHEFFKAKLNSFYF